MTTTQTHKYTKIKLQLITQDVESKLSKLMIFCMFNTLGLIQPTMQTSLLTTFMTIHT